VIETSITLKNLIVVIDAGVFKQEFYDETFGINQLRTKLVSDAQNE
jgi:HrpA-like RNA helicase